MTNQSTEEAWKHTFELFKLEYEQASERFENIYKAIWQIFSYMGILAAGILTFASRNSSSLPIQVTAFIALTPLLFWFLAIYIPMNNYGYKAGEHLENMEYKFNEISKDFVHPFWELKHYRDFAARRKNSNSDSKKIKFPWRVQSIVWFFGIVIFIAWLFCLYFSFSYYRNSISNSVSEKIRLKEPIELTMQQSQLQELQNKLDSLSQQIDSIESLMRDIKVNSNQQ